jgi:hypothetical protein
VEAVRVTGTAARRDLYGSLRGQVSNQALREAMLAAHGMKVARLCIPEDQVGRTAETLENAGLWVDLHDMKHVVSSDSGKGGWVSGYGVEVPIEFPGTGYLLLYAGDDPAEVLAAKKAEHSNSHARFGSLLGYPECCTRFYDENLAIAEEAQGDFFLQLLDASVPPGAEGPCVFPAWTNVAPQYFGYGLISFYPCSFFCERAKTVAIRSHQVLSGYDPGLADEFLRYARAPVLYTEYEGIYLFHDAKLAGNTMIYDPGKVESTLDGVLASVVRSCDRARVLGCHSVVLKEGDREAAYLSSPSMGLVFFE